VDVHLEAFAFVVGKLQKRHGLLTQQQIYVLSRVFFEVPILQHHLQLIHLLLAQLLRLLLRSLLRIGASLRLALHRLPALLLFHFACFALDGLLLNFGFRILV